MTLKTSLSPTPKVVATTRSVCPACLGVISARIVEEEGRIYMEKSCQEHGDFRALVWSDSEMYKAYSGMFRFGDKPPLTNACPLECGLCDSHELGTCLAIVEVTDRCNLRCGTCIASAAEGKRKEPTLEEIEDCFRTVIANGGASRPVQLSGGEPTTRRDLPEIVRMGRELGLKHIEIDTNGVLLGRNPNLAKELSQAGVSAVYLQFDGFDDRINVALRGRALLEHKLKAIENCRDNHLAVVLVPTVVRGINDDQLGKIIEFAIKNDIVKGVNFQPATYMGRFASADIDVSERATIPDVLKAIELQTGGALRADDFYPIPSLHHSCTAVTLVLAGEEGFMPLSRLVDAVKVVNEMESPCCTVTKAIPRLWDVSNERDSFNKLREYIGKLGFEIENAESKKILSISMMAFQDCWTLDVDRLQKCRAHMIRPGGRIVPLCAYYLTGTDGRRLY
jgi:uncharacterized radical SAM superfamily Fe-S cluster-containing enzyme